MKWCFSEDFPRLVDVNLSHSPLEQKIVLFLCIIFTFASEDGLKVGLTGYLEIRLLSLSCGFSFC